MELASQRIGFIGGGAMATALAGGLIEAGVSCDQIRVAEPDPDRRKTVAAQLGVEAVSDNTSAVAEADVVVVAVKPDVVAIALASAGGPEAAPSTPLWISIAAGATLARLAASLPEGARIVRAMPNTPALVGAGVTAICPNASAHVEDLATARALFDSVGQTWVAPNEALLDPVTGLSGSGPAYVFLLMESLIEAGLAVGLPAEAARQLTLQTVLGAARLALETGRDPADLRVQVTSPGGTTQAALERLGAGGFRELVIDAVRVATERSRELAAG